PLEILRVAPALLELLEVAAARERPPRDLEQLTLTRDVIQFQRGVERGAHGLPVDVHRGTGVAALGAEPAGQRRTHALQGGRGLPQGGARRGSVWILADVFLLPNPGDRRRLVHGAEQRRRRLGVAG